MSKKIEEKKPEEKIEAGISIEEKTNLSGFDMKDFIAKPFETGIILRKEVTKIPVTRPNSQIFFRIHPTLEIPVYLVEWKEENERYLVHKNALQFLENEAKLNLLYLGMLQSGNPFFYPIPQRDEKGRWNSWHESSFSVVKKAKEKWVREIPEKSINGYTVVVAISNLPEPGWPEKPLDELVLIAFRERIIMDENHTLIKQLKGL
jgi:hypothetical protein